MWITPKKLVLTGGGVVANLPTANPFQGPDGAVVMPPPHRDS